MSPFNSPKFKKLLATWNKKLEKSGFQDIEHDGQLKVPSYHLVKRKVLHRFESQREYYRLASVFLHEHAFTSPADKFIWSHYVEGKHTVEISALLKSHKFKSTSHDYVGDRVKALTKIMLEKYKVSTKNE